jgi:predicted  nucleic acid-binding Zn-ribbon protein
MLACRYQCRACSHAFDGAPGYVVDGCPACGHAYVRWTNYAAWRATAPNRRVSGARWLDESGPVPEWVAGWWPGHSAEEVERRRAR